MGDPDYDDVIFWRTAGSGGRATNRAKKKKKTSHAHGDITFTDPVGKPLIDMFVVECKRGYNRNSINDLIDRPGHLKERPEDSYADWIYKQIDKSVRLGIPYWLLIHKRDKREPLAFFPGKLQADLDRMQGKVAHVPLVGRFYPVIDDVPEHVCVCLLDDFLDNIDREAVEWLAGSKR